MIPLFSRNPAFALALVALLGATPESIEARSQNAPAIGGATEGSQRISMGVGKSLILDLPQDAAEIFVGNPAVANAIVRTARKLYIIGVANGQTSVYALDRQGHQFASFEINIGRDVGELGQILRAALPGTDIVARTINDTIILTGTVDSAEDAQRASDIAKGFAKSANLGGASAANADGLVVNSLVIRGRDQVMLKVTVSEMRRDIVKQLGVTSSTWGPLTQANPFGINGQYSATALQIASGSNLSATLQAFERYGVSRTLAEPTVTAVSGENAKFTVGGQFPYPTGTVCVTTTSCTTGGAAFKDYGITLNFSPVILSEGRILLHLATEVTDIDFQNSVIISGTPTPGVRTRKNETTIELPSGGSIATAGLIEQQTRQVINGLPGLLNLPILGTLFRSRDYLRSETELMIIVTPIIVKAVKPNEIARPDDGFAEASDPQSWLLGRVNRLYATPSNPEAVKNYRGRVGFIQD
ncbi:type II and III secretion system protein family protein [Beijerinckia sp. L45]|uniref:type II and III secretion system protein family protein n=1 Tax=Beijerinckia sp. L45 TaxID=1641855 RepID=UPI00131E92BF|nr:type II and III secretion system protein family protein [Beijerinckia sp. L45]